MGSGVVMRRWCAALAALFTLAAAAPALAQAQQPPATAGDGYLGVELRTLTREEAQTLRLSASGAAVVTKVEADSPARALGLKRGDILLEIDDKPVASAAQALKLIASKKPCTAVRVRAQREGLAGGRPVMLGMRPEERAPATSLATREVPATMQQRQDPVTAVGVVAQDKFRAEVVPQLGHTQDVASAAFSPDGRFALSGAGSYRNGELKLWELATGKQLRSFRGHEEKVKSIAFSPDGRFALSDSGKTLTLWDVATGTELYNFCGVQRRCRFGGVLGRWPFRPVRRLRRYCETVGRGHRRGIARHERACGAYLFGGNFARWPFHPIYRLRWKRHSLPPLPKAETVERGYRQDATQLQRASGECQFGIFAR